MAGFRAHADDPDARFASVEVVKRETDFKTQSVTYSTIGEGWARPVVGLAVQVTFPNTGAPQRPVHDRGTEFRGDATEAPAGEKEVHTFGHSRAVLPGPVPSWPIPAHRWYLRKRSRRDGLGRSRTSRIPLSRWRHGFKSRWDYAGQTIRRVQSTRRHSANIRQRFPYSPRISASRYSPMGSFARRARSDSHAPCTSSESALTLIPSHATEGGDGGGDGDGGD